MIRPLTIAECDEQLLLTHARYLRAERAYDVDAASRFYRELDVLLDIRTHLPLPRVSPENGGSPCGDASTSAST